MNERSVFDLEPEVHPVQRLFLIRWGDNTFKTSDYVHCYIGVDNYTGQIGFWQPRGDAWPNEIIEELVERELAEWRAIGPEDSELFATDKLMEVWMKAWTDRGE